jgi:hypothetical protein
MGVLTDAMGLYKSYKGRKKGGGSGSKPQTDTGNANAAGDLPGLPDYHRGGKVRKSGAANLRKGEVVLTAREARRKKKGRSKSR